MSIRLLKRSLTSPKLGLTAFPPFRHAKLHTRSTPSYPKVSSAIASGALAVTFAVAAYTLSASPKVTLEALHATEEHPECVSLTAKEVAAHNNRETGIWVVIDDEVWAVTDFLDQHPGGANIIINNAGKDVTALFKPIHPPGTLEKFLSEENKVGELSDDELALLKSSSSLGDEAEKVSRAKKNVRHIDTVVNLDDFEKICLEDGILSSSGIAYYASGSETESTLRHNITAWSDIMFRPRVMRKVRDVNTETTILGVPTSLPVYISPAALARLGSEDGEMNLVKGAEQTGVLYCISSNSSCSLDELDSVRGKDQKLFWQYYVNSDRQKAREALKNALDHNMNSIWVTVDAPVGGKRERDLRHKLELDPPSDDKPQQKGQSVSEQMFSFVDPNLCWDDLKWIKETAGDKVSLVVKGIGCVEDAVLAAEHGCDGIVLSNHGGRQLDGARPGIEVLIEIRKKNPEVFDKLEVFVDGGVRRGTDVLKALALGATAVGLGRSPLYAQTAYDSRGIVKMVEIMKAEIETGMRLLGVTKISELTPDYVEVLDRASQK